MQTEQTYSPTFNLALFSKLSAERNNKVFNMADKDNFYYLSCLMGELGELANAIKKLDRGFNIRELKIMQEEFNRTNPGKPLPDNDFLQTVWTNARMEECSAEAADVYIYFDLLCTKNEINIWENLKTKFNLVSDQMGAGAYKIQ